MCNIKSKRVSVTSFYLQVTLNILFLNMDFQLGIFSGKCYPFIGVMSFCRNSSAPASLFVCVMRLVSPYVLLDITCYHKLTNTMYSMNTTLTQFL